MRPLSGLTRQGCSGIALTDVVFRCETYCVSLRSRMPSKDRRLLTADGSSFVIPSPPNTLRQQPSIDGLVERMSEDTGGAAPRAPSGPRSADRYAIVGHGSGSRVCVRTRRRLVRLVEGSLLQAELRTIRRDRQTSPTVYQHVDGPPVTPRIHRILLELPLPGHSSYSDVRWRSSLGRSTTTPTEAGVQPPPPIPPAGGGHLA